MDTTLAQLKTQIEELEKRIKSLSNQVTTQGYMTGLKTCLEEIKTLFSTYQTQLNQHLNDYQTHTNTFNSHLSNYETLCSTVDSINEDIVAINSTLSLLSDTPQDITEIQQTISTINQTLTTLTSTIQSTSQDIEDLQDDISSINTTLNASTQDISEINADIADINSTLTNLSGINQEVEDLQNDVLEINSTLSTLTGVTQDISELESDVSGINESISTISSSIVDLQSADTALSARITTLENESGSGSGSSGTVSSLVFKKEQISAKVYQSSGYTYKTPKCQFICDTSGKVTISYQIIGKVETADVTYARMRIYLNDEEVKDRNIDVAVGAFNVSDSFTFIPNEAYNYFYVQLSIGEITVREYTMSVEGYNVEILQQELPMTINCFNNSYYILMLDDYRRRLYYGVQSKEELDISTSSLSYVSATNTPSDGISYLYLVPTTRVENGVVVFDTSYSEQCKLIGSLTKSGTLASFTIDSSSITDENEYSSDVTYYEPIVGGMGVETSSDFYGDAIFMIDMYGMVSLMGSGSGLGDAITLNGEQIYSSSYRIGAVVRDINNKINSPSYFRGVIVWDKDTNKNIFLPSISSSYSVEIAEGKNVTAYYQTNGDINVYINRGTNVYKYVLQKNSQNNQYELSQTITTLEGITRYEELYDGNYLVYRNTQWEILSSE